MSLDLLARTALVVLINSVWQGALIAASTWLALRLFREVNASTRYAAWVVALLAIPIVAVATSLPQIEFTKAQPTTQAPLHSHIATTQRVSTARTTFPERAEQRQPRVTIPHRPAVHLNAPFLAAAILFGVWGLAVLAMLGRLGIALARLEKLKHDALPLGIDVRDRLEQYRRASESSRNVRICITEGIDVPVAVGLFDAMVLLPQHLIDTLETSELDQITLHELAHLLRHDDWTNGLQRFISALFFFNPAVWFIGRQLDIEREVACDDYVLVLTGAVRSYAFCLTKMAEMTAWPHQPLAAPGVFITRKNISIRIERLLRSGRAISSSISPGIAGGVVGGLIVAGAIAWMGTPRIAFALPAPVETPAPMTASVSTPKALPTLHQSRNVSTLPSTVAAAGTPPAVPTPIPTPVPKANVRTNSVVVEVPKVTVPKIDIPPVHVNIPPVHVDVPNIDDKQVAQGAMSCVGCNYSGGHFAGKDFSRANLMGSDFSSADLRGARFESSNLSGSNFENADLRNARFLHANLSGCNLRGAKLDGATFESTNVAGCNIDASALTPQQAVAFLERCAGCDLEGAHLDGMNLSGLHLSGVNLENASLRNANLSNTRFSGVNLSGVDFSGANLDGAVINGCNLAHANLRNVDLSKTKMIGSSLSDAEMNP